MSKKTKHIPCIVASREGLQGIVGEIIQLRLEHTALTTEMEQELAAVQRKYQPRLMTLARQIQSRESGAYVWCHTNRPAFGEKKSLELPCATIGFRLTPPRVEKLLERDTWSAVARRLELLDWGKTFVSYAEPAPNKEALLRERVKLTTEQLHQAGISIAQDENFFIDPKSEVLEAISKREAA